MLNTSILHSNEIPISTEFVRKLVDHTFPKYAGMPLSRFGESGSSNVLFRLGEDLLVRLPRQPGGGISIQKEHRWLSEIGARLPVAVPEIVELGEPMFDYSERWSIVRWINGETPNADSASRTQASARLKLAVEVADVVQALRAVKLTADAVCDVHLRCYRGRSLVEFDNLTRQNIRSCRTIDRLDINLDVALSVWSDAVTLPEAHKVGEDSWYHGDLVAENLLLSNGSLSAILDFGGLGVGDPTVDLHGAWELFDAPCRDAFRDRLGVDDSHWLRGRAWALGISLNAITYYWTTMPNRMKDRVAMVQSIIDDASS